MSCIESINKKKKWDYCTLSPDRIFGVYIGCCCKEHDKDYATSGKIKSRKKADMKLRRNIERVFKSQNKAFLGKIIAFIYWLIVRAFGSFYWKKWSLKGVQKYK